MKILNRRNFFIYSLLFVTSCKRATNSTKEGSSKIVGSRPDKLRFTVTDRKSLELLQRDYEPFRQALEQLLEKKIEFSPTENYIAAASALALDRVDLVLAGPSEYVLIRSRTNAVPVVTLKRQNNYAIMVVRADSNIKSLKQLKGKTIGMGEVGGTSSHIAPTKFLIDAGLNPQSDVKIRMLGTEGNRGLLELKKGGIDAWGGSFHRYKKFLKAEGVTDKEYRLLTTGLLLPGDIFVANSKLDPALVEEIRSIMLINQDKLMSALQAPEANLKFQDGKLQPPNDADYNMIREVYKVIGQSDFIQ